MSASRARSRWAQSVPGVAVLLVLAGGLSLPAVGAEDGEAAGEIGAPISLGPPTLLVPKDDQELAPGTLTPARAAGFNPAEEPAINRPRLGIRGIEVNALGEVDPDSIGILGPDSGGFSTDMWRGSSRKAVERLLPRLPSVMTSATMRSLAQRLLLSNATAPRRRGPDIGSRDSSLLALRVDRLATLGDIEGLNGLLKVVPQRVDDEAIGRARVEGLLLDGKIEGACRQVRNRIAENHDIPYWRKALVFCQIHSGEIDQAMLGVGLMREQGLSDDPTFFSLVDAYGGAELTKVAVASPLHLAMLDVVGGSIPEDLIEAASPGILVAIAKSPAVDLEQRVRAGELTVAFGVLQTGFLAALYETFAFEPAELENPLKTALEIEGPRSRALLYQAARAGERPSARAELLRLLLEEAEKADLYQTAIQLLLPMLVETPAIPELVWFAETAGRALYAAGYYGRAGAWLTLAHQESIIDPQAGAAVTALWPFSRLAGRPILSWAVNLEVWRAARANGSPDERDQVALLRNAFMALGESDSMNWIDLASEMVDSDQPAPDASLLYALDNASNLRRLGETVLLSLLVLGEQGPAGCHPLALNSVLRSMRVVGLEREARALAIEAAIARGI